MMNTTTGLYCVLLRPRYQHRPVKQKVIRNQNPYCLLLRQQKAGILTKLKYFLIG